VGFFKPHLPFVAPTRYWQNYAFADIHLPDNYFVPKGAPPMAIHNSGELRAYADVPRQGPVDDEFARRLIHGYYACVSYTDAHIGRLLDQLDELGIANNTIIVLWGDHGWNLGEHTLWCKHCCFETSMNAPLIVSAPMLDGVKTETATMAPTEFIDIYPSLCDLAGLPVPDHLQGESFVPVLKDPYTSVKQAAIGRFGPGDTIRTARYRFTLYSDKQGQPVGRMLYDHQEDPGENVNIAERPKNAELVRRLTEQLKVGMGKPSPGKRE
jgi:arylsulfatase A-like enzyme